MITRPMIARPMIASSPPGSRLAAALALLLLTAGLAPDAAAWPVFDEGEVLAGVRVFPDHEDRRRFWFVADHVEASTDKGTGQPAFVFERFRYLGGDDGNDAAPWGRGVLTFRLRRGLAGELDEVRRLVARRAGAAARLDPLPLAGLRVDLVYAAGDRVGTYHASSDGAEPDGATSGGTTAAVWTERAFAVGLAPQNADILWSAFHQDTVALSVAYELEALGLRNRPDADPGIPGFQPEDDEPQPQRVALGGDAFALDVSPRSCPSCFRSTDLDAEIPAGYATVAVYCHDFELAGRGDDLAGVQVEVKAFAVSGDRPVQSHRFRAGEAPRGEIHFPFAVGIDDGYEFRKIYLYTDGHVEAEPWARRTTWSRLLDVTRRGAPPTDAPDPRDFY